MASRVPPDLDLHLNDDGDAKEPSEDQQIWLGIAEKLRAKAALFLCEIMPAQDIDSMEKITGVLERSFKLCQFASVYDQMMAAAKRRLNEGDDGLFEDD